MRLTGLHHITMITGDAQRNVDFYADTLGLRFVKKTVNFDAPEAYHLYFGDEKGTPGTILTWFEFPGAAAGRPGIGQIHTLQLAVPSEAALDFWAARLGVERHGDHIHFQDPDGLQLELVVESLGNAPLTAQHPEIPAEHALQGFEGVRAYSSNPDASRSLLEETMGFEPRGELFWESRGDIRGSTYAYDEPPEKVGVQGAGTVHHVAWASPAEEHEAWRDRVLAAGMHATPVIDRFYFRSVYYREPSGVLFEIATLGGPGFAIDEPVEHLGEKLSLPPFIEHLRPEIEPRLRPITNPRQVAAG